MKKRACAALEPERRKAAGEDRACINSNPIRSDHWLTLRRVSVNHNFPEWFLRPQKLMSYPKQIGGLLFVEWHARAHAGVYEHIVPDLELEFQISKEVQMLLRNSFLEGFSPGSWLSSSALESANIDTVG